MTHRTLSQILAELMVLNLFIFNRIVDEWNSLPNHIRESNSIETFKKEVLSFIKVIPQKLNLPMIFCETFPESSLLSIVSKKIIKMIGHHSRLRDVIGQSYPI